ncbi:hypothetical protein ScPMuIL_003794 [Solemya velum]
MRFLFLFITYNLQLAAELGKALLERNRELEAQIFQLQQTNSEQSLEIEYMTRQLETVRETAESRMRMCEELDKAVQDLEKTNQRLSLDSKADKQKIEKLCSNFENLEEKCEELQKSLDEMKAKEKKLQKQKKDEPHRKRRRDDLETETSLLWDENQAQEVRIKELEEHLKHKDKLEDELLNLRHKYAIICEQCGDHLSPDLRNVLESEIEHDNPQVGRRKMVKLEGGGSAYGSTGSNDDLPNLGAESLDPEMDDQDNAGVSILNELEVQYESLFQKYDALLQGKGKRPPSFGDEETLDEALQKHLRGVSHKEVQTLLKTFDSTVAHEAIGDAEGPPPYKTIFRDIFETLRKSRIEEGGELPPITSGHSTPATTPLTSEKKPLGGEVVYE